MRIKVLIFFLTTTSFAHAGDSQLEQEFEADCKKINKYAKSGDKYYKLKSFAMARKEYEKQVAWSESCEALEEYSRRYDVTTAYNNVALTYMHEGSYLKAKAWLNIKPKDKKSVFNLNKIKKEIQISEENFSSSPVGVYWDYAGKSFWNVITVTKLREQYRIDFNGYYAGLMAMYAGPNMGEFSTILEIKNGHAKYSMSNDDDLLDCVYDFTFKGNSLTVKLASGKQCGFGHNVTADGVYGKVEH